jgi:pyridoxamine 5'-phosphate oxidase
MNLPIDIRFGQIVEIDHCDATDGAARQRLDYPGTYAADTNYANVGNPETRQRSIAIQAGDTAKAPVEVYFFEWQYVFCQFYRHHGAILTERSIYGHNVDCSDAAHRAHRHVKLKGIAMSAPLFDPAPDFDQPIAVLKHCHDRIRKQLRTLEKMLDHLPEFGADRDARQGATAVLRYFNSAAAQHHADEEQDLLPMLRATAQGDDALTLESMLPEIVQEHLQMEAIWLALAQQLSEIASGASSTLSGDNVRQFVALYTAHMEKEEAHIAPMAKRLFSPEQMATLGQAMKNRRGI